MLYTAKCYWPGASDGGLEDAVARAGAVSRESSPASLRGALYLPGDDLVLCLFDAPSRAAVKRASEEAGLPCERVIETVLIAPIQHKADGSDPDEGGG
jgi:Nickel responsive protein SCO4226-like